MFRLAIMQKLDLGQVSLDLKSINHYESPLLSVESRGIIRHEI